MASINKQSVREEFEKIKSSFDEQAPIQARNATKLGCCL
jgi:hypothetical protein